MTRKLPDPNDSDIAILRN